MKSLLYLIIIILSTTLYLKEEEYNKIFPNVNEDIDAFRNRQPCEAYNSAPEKPNIEKNCVDRQKIDALMLTGHNVEAELLMRKYYGLVHTNK
jgi:hypothetical protein